MLTPGTMCRAVLLAAGLGVLAACQAPSSPAPRAATAVAEDALAQARIAVSRGDHASAASILSEIVQAGSTVIEAHYLLAVSMSYLDQADAARREFEWVVAHGEPSSTEVAIARDWLAARAPVATASAVSWSNVTPEPQRPDLASVSGRAVDAVGPKTRLLLILKGVLGGPTQDEFRSLRTDASGQFAFANVAPGDYILTNAVAGPVIWRLRVALARGESRSLDLTPSNDATVRDDAPEAR